MRNYLLTRKIVFSLLFLIGFGGLTIGQTKNTSKSASGEPFQIKNVIVGSVDDSTDFSASVKLNYDGDSIYMFFEVTDDSIVNAGTAYQVDNIEVYLDLHNTKNIHWPRNGGWVQAVDAAFDSTDYQFRLVPDSAFTVNNGSFPGVDTTAHQVYTRTATGYTFELNIKWNDMKAGFSQVSSTAFEQVSGTLMGFDVLVSDNDAVASDANRNQITLNSSTDKPFNDPSLWGTIEAQVDGSFKLIPDTEAPTDPSNLAATVSGADVDFSWDASTDNTAVLKYIVSVDGTDEADPIYPQTADAAVTDKLSSLAVGTHTLGVKAVDNNKNESAVATVKAVILDINDMNDVVFEAYPNPMTDLLYIKNASSISSIQVIGINGSVVGTKVNSGQDQMLLNVSDLNQGIYILKVTTVDGSVQTTKLVKK